jgi:hypothetical protein
MGGTDMSENGNTAWLPKRRSGRGAEDHIDITMIAALRPSVVNKTLQSLTSNVKTEKSLRLIMDVAHVGEAGVKQKDIVDIAKSHFDDVVSRTRRVSLQAEAQRWVWNSSLSEHVLQWEDDWVLSTEIDVDKVGLLFDRYPNTAIIFMDRIGKSVRDYEGYRGMFERVEGGVYRRVKHKTFGGPPALVCRPFLLGVCEHIKDNESLDTTCRTPEGQRFLKDWENLVFAPNERGLVYDIGKRWRREQGLVMKKKTNKGVLWVKG